MNWVTEIINDTLKRRDISDGGRLKWSRTSLTMFTAWVAVLYTYVHQFVSVGFNEPAFYAMCGIALGAKVTDSWAKKLMPDATQPDPTKQ